MLPTIFDHLWQSTLFATVAGLLTLALRKNRARVRHGVWFAAGCKFLIPISLLISLGSQFASRTPQPSSSISVALDKVSEPFTAPPSALPSIPTQPSANPLPAILFGIWLCGFIVIASTWLIRWRRIRTTVRNAPSANLALPIEAKYSPALIEPGVFGIVRPILLLPEGIANRLTSEQLNAVIAHELCHIRHRDNLTAAIQMFIETVFWFHPFVWWIGQRLLAEREQACDEEVLQLGSDPRIYAESILNVCKLYIEFPLTCVSGITGSDLKKRIHAILAIRAPRDLSFAKKAALSTAGLAALAFPIALGMIHPRIIRAQSESAIRPTFEVASVKPYKDDGGPRNSASYGPQGIDFGGLTLAFIIGEAYDFAVGRIQGPGSLTKESLWAPLRQGYDIVAKADHPVTKDELRLMLQSLLADRFRLTLHRETATGPVYKLVVAKNGLKLDESQAGGIFSFSGGPEGYTFRNAKAMRLAGFLSGQLNRAVVDQTGLKGRYDFILKRLEDTPATKSDGISPDSQSAGAFAEGLKQLGLQLVAGTAPVEYLIIDHVEKPSEN